MPELDRVSRDYEAKKRPVVFLAVDYKETPQTIRAWIKNNGLMTRILVDGNGAATERYLVRGFPTAFIIDRQGVIRDKVVGALDAAFVKARIDAIL